MGYAYQATVTIPAASGETLTYISIAITGSATELKTVGNGGQIQNTVTRVNMSVPADLIVSSDVAGTALYNWGFDVYDPVSGLVTIWVLIPSLSNSSSLTLYISIGNVAVNTFQGGTQGAEFDGNTKAVYHFSESAYGTGSTAYDSSALSNNLTVQSSNGTAIGVTDVGKINAGAKGALKLPNTSVFAGSFATSGAVSGISTTVGTVSAWVQFIANTSFDTSNNTLVATGKDSPYNYFGLITMASPSHNAGAVMSNGGGPPNVSAGNTGALSNSVWYFLVMTYDGTNMNIYLNGALVNATPGVFARTGDAPININTSTSDYIGFRYQNAIYDEVRCINVSRNANWIATEYANQSSIPTIGAFGALLPSLASWLGVTSEPQRVLGRRVGLYVPTSTINPVTPPAIVGGMGGQLPLLGIQ